MNGLIKRVSALLTGVFLLSILAGCGILPKEEKVLAPPIITPKKQVYDLYSIKRGSIEKVFKGVATFTPSREKTLYYKESGFRLKTLAVKTGETVKKGQLLAELDTGSLYSEIKHGEFRLKKAQLELKKQEEFKKNGGELNPYDLEKLKIDVSDAQLTVNDMKNAYYKAKLISPIDGVVVYVADTKEGNFVEPYKTLVQVSDPKDLQLAYQVSETKASNEIKMGMKAVVTINGQVYDGQVTSTPMELPADADEKYKNIIVIDVEGAPEGIRMGGMADFAISLEKKDNVLVIPMRGLRQYVGREYVEIIENGTKKEMDVETGIQTATEVEIVKGLKEGQQVILK